MLWDSQFIPRHWQQRGAVTTTGCSNPRRPAVPPFHRPHLHSALHCLEPLFLHRIPPAPSLSTCHVASVQSLLAFPPHRTSSVVSTLRGDSCHQRRVPPRRGTARTEKQGEIFHLGSFPLFIPPSAQPNLDRSVRHLAPAWAACQDHSESRLADERERPARPGARWAGQAAGLRGHQVCSCIQDVALPLPRPAEGQAQLGRRDERLPHDLC